ncbi:hypothetical protein GCM10010371_32320 [Streptomyces subrutilus]|uniref:Uncharacterized protein n=1 Tax=Streptomyces subrutilus TaxID=36818 RepID=A0A918QRT1_9ACTN|nr:hypothetical protein GCM10010371_32320 [Streptomyces subrutilus]
MYEDGSSGPIVTEERGEVREAAGAAGAAAGAKAPVGAVDPGDADAGRTPRGMAAAPAPARTART